MPDAKYSRDLQRLDFIGLDLNRPVDSVKPGKIPYGKNIRSFVAGRIECRDGITDIAQVVAGQSPVHSCRRLNDPNSAYDPASVDWTRIVGTGAHLAYGQASFTDADSGYSGNPLALVPWTPVGAPTAYMYVGDSLRMRKIRTTGLLDTIGYAPPNIAPTVEPSVPYYKDVDLFQATAGWNNTGTAGAPALLSVGAYRTSTTISVILYDSGTSGWASIGLASMVGVGVGERLIVNHGAGNTETQTVQSVFAQSSATTIASILYDSGGGTGACSIVLTNAISQIQCDALLQDSTVSESVRIVGVTIGPTGLVSIRAVTVGTWAVGDAIFVLSSLRMYLANTHAGGENVRIDGIGTVLSGAGVGFLTKTSALDLSILAAGVPSSPDDFMHFSVLFTGGAITSVKEIKLQLDVDSGTNDFTRNFYFKAFSGSALAPVIANTQTSLQAQQQALQNEILQATPPSQQNPFEQAIINQLLSGQPITATTNLSADGGTFQVNPANLPLAQQQLNFINQQLASGETTSPGIDLGEGLNVWVELVCRISDLTRVGTDTTRTLANVAALQVVMTTSAAITVDMDCWWIGGGYGPDTSDSTAVPYLYRYRVRNPLTNVPSNFSPASRYAATPERQQVTVTMPQYAAPAGTSLAATDLVIDISRFGGQLADWHYVGTIPNSATPSFTDIYGDNIVAGNPIQANTNYQPWPIIGKPVSGTTGIVSGTSVKDSGTNFNLAWAMGTRILIASQPYTIYRVISTSLLEIVENAGSQTGVVWTITEPTILAQPLPCLWFDAQNNVFFACGDIVNPGRLYYSNPSMETTVPANYLDVTSPSEPLMNGLAYNIRSYIFSSENFFQILSTASFEALAQNSLISSASIAFEAQKIPNGKGMFSQWGLTREPSPVICFLSKDGINMSTGGAPIALSDADLYELFPNEGQLGVTINGIAPPNVIQAQAANLRLTYYDEYLYFDYVDTTGTRATLALAFDLGAATRGEAPGGWLWDVYMGNPDGGGVGVFHYGEEGSGVHALLIGGSDGNLYQYAGFSDNGNAISMEFSTPCRDQGDPRSQKLYGDIMLDAMTAGLNAQCVTYFDNNTRAVAAVTVNSAVRTQSAIQFNGNVWQTARNISLNVITLVSTASRPFFYIWEPRWTFESAPILAFSWDISPSTLGTDNFKSIGMCKVTHVSTADLSLVFTVDGVAQPAITIPNSAGIYTQTVFRVPVMKGKLYRANISSSVEWRLDGRDSFFEIKNWASDDMYQKMRIYSDFAEIRG
jgi:hypothetical protein